MDNQQEISQVQLAYLGGLVDGEGSVGITVQTKKSRTKDGGSAFSLTPFIQFCNTEAVLVDNYRAILDSLNVAYYVSYREAQGRNAASWNIVTRGLKRTLTLLPYLAKWCRGKKKENAQDLLEYCDSRLADWHGAPFTEHQIKLARRISLRNYGAKWEPILRDYTRSSRSSKYPNG